MTKKIIIFDTTLRDGEQSPGMSMNREEKLPVAHCLDAMGVDVIEAGFAIASQGDFDSISAISESVKNAVICSLARAKQADIERAAEALKKAKRSRIHTFISTSPIHLKYQLNMSEDEVLEAIKFSVGLARKFTDDVEWSAMDATRSDKNYLCKTVETAIKHGATTINIPDTVGYATPQDFGELIKYIKNNVANIDKAIISVHCQNDLGLATANSLAGISAGAGQIECTINGIGERAGNAALEEVVMAIKTRKDILDADTNIKTEHIMRASRLVSSITGAAVQVNKAIVGANAFAHESGIHQDGMLKHSGTYEIMRPESVGLQKSNLVLGKHSGRHAFKDKLKELGIEAGDNSINELFDRFKKLADSKKEVFDEDIIALIDNGSFGIKRKYQLVSVSINCGGKEHKAKVTMKINDKEESVEMSGNGPIDAIFTAVKSIVGENPHLQLYQVHAVTGGTDAQAEVTVRMELNGKSSTGHATHIDTIIASTNAYINAIEKLEEVSSNKKIGLLDKAEEN